MAVLELSDRDHLIADRVFREIRERMQFLLDVGLDYLTLARSAATLAGGEAQRIRLASQIGSGLVGVLYVLDEPSIGLHQRDNQRLIETLMRLRDLGQHRDRGRARRGDHPGGRPRGRHRPRAPASTAAGSSTPGRSTGPAASSPRPIAHRPVPLGARSIPVPGQCGGRAAASR